MDEKLPHLLKRTFGAEDLEYTLTRRRAEKWVTESFLPLRIILARGSQTAEHSVYMRVNARNKQAEVAGQHWGMSSNELLDGGFQLPDDMAACIRAAKVIQDDFSLDDSRWHIVGMDYTFSGLTLDEAEKLAIGKERI